MSKKETGGNPLNMQIGGPRKVRYPDKEVINFIGSDNRKKSDGKALVIFTLFMAALLVFIYFGVIKQLDRIDEAETIYKEAKITLDEYKTKNEELAGVAEEYNARVEMYYTDEESQYSNRKEIIDMLNEDVLPYLDDLSVVVSADNQISIYANQADFESVSMVLDILKDDDRIYYVNVTTSNQQSSEEEGSLSYTVDAQYEITWNTEDTLTETDMTEGSEVDEDA